MRQSLQQFPLPHGAIVALPTEITATNITDAGGNTAEMRNVDFVNAIPKAGPTG
jgi:hypothetical protein